MLRDKSLIPLSRQHQHALALCVRIERAAKAGELDVDAFQAEIQQLVEQEIAVHFPAEEKDVFPVAARVPELRDTVNELLAEHSTLRDYFSRATTRTLDVASLMALGETLSAHIRKEERQLFEGMQKLMDEETLATIGGSLEHSLADASEACILPRGKISNR